MCHQIVRSGMVVAHRGRVSSDSQIVRGGIVVAHRPLATLVPAYV